MGFCPRLATDRSTGFHSRNLTDEIQKSRLAQGQAALAGATGFEPAISGLTGRHVHHYTTPPHNEGNYTTFRPRRQIERAGLDIENGGLTE